MKRVKSYMSGALVAVLLFHLPFLKKWRLSYINNNDSQDDKKQIEHNFSSLKTIKLEEAIEKDQSTFYQSSLLGKTVLFHKLEEKGEYDYQNYGFAGNIVNIYKDDDHIKFDVKLFLSNTGVCINELQKIIRKEISKDLILKGFERSELNLA